MSTAAQRSLQVTIISALVGLLGLLASTLWNQQQGIIQQLSDRLLRLESACKTATDSAVGRSFLAFTQRSAP